MLSLFAPDVPWQWPPPTPLATDTYPFSARPSAPLTRSNLISLARDVYRNAAHPTLDLTKGLAAGPYGDPARYDVPSVRLPPGAGGSFPRAISIVRTSYSHIAELGRPGVAGRVWAAQGPPHAAVYSPLHLLSVATERAPPSDAPPPTAVAATAAAAASALELPPCFTRGSLHRTDAFDASPELSSGWWRTALVNHWARAAGYDFAWAKIEAAQAEEERASAEAADAAEAAAAAASDATRAATLLAAADKAAADRSARAWRDLIMRLMVYLHDGYVVDANLPTINVSKLFYPAVWLEKVGYYGPRFYPCNGPCQVAAAANKLVFDAAGEPSAPRHAASSAVASPDVSQRPATIVASAMSSFTSPRIAGSSASLAAASPAPSASVWGPAALALAAGAAIFGGGYAVGRRAAREEEEARQEAADAYHDFQRVHS